MEKLVSVILPVYNAEKYILNTLKSAVNQTYKNIEIIIINDCSTDKSLEIINSVNDSRVKVLNLETNGGVANARNKGLEIAQGEFIAFLDSDDIWFHNKLEKQVEFMIENNLEFSFTNYILKSKNKEKKIIVNKKVVNYDYLLKGNVIALFTVILKADISQKTKFSKIKHEDYLYWLKILEYKNAHLLDDVLGEYNKVEGSLSSNKFKAALWQWNIYNKLKIRFVKKIYYFVNYFFKALIKHM